VDEVIAARELRGIARERRIPLDLAEKDYALGWVMIGLSSITPGDRLIFKGGTALSKVYFPSSWRISEDLDYTLNEGADLEDAAEMLSTLPETLGEISGGLALTLKEKPYMNPGFLRVRAQYDGPITRGTIKIEISREAFIGDKERISVPKMYDYPEYEILVYSINNILAEKMRAVIERGAVRDYYDVWRLLRTGRVDIERARELFLRKCRGKGVVFEGLDQFFPDGLEASLEPYVKMGLARLSPDPLPKMEVILTELRDDLSNIFS